MARTFRALYGLYRVFRLAGGPGKAATPSPSFRAPKDTPCRLPGTLLRARAYPFFAYMRSRSWRNPARVDLISSFFFFFFFFSFFFFFFFFFLPVSAPRPLGSSCSYSITPPERQGKGKRGPRGVHFRQIEVNASPRGTPSGKRKTAENAGAASTQRDFTISDSGIWLTKFFFNFQSRKRRLTYP